MLERGRNPRSLGRGGCQFSLFLGTDCVVLTGDLTERRAQGFRYSLSHVVERSRVS